MLRIVGILMLSQTIFAQETSAPAADLSTHRQSSVIRMADDKLPLNAFCLNHDGNIVAVCGHGPGEVRVINPDGEILASCSTNAKPEAVTVNDRGDILLASDGKLFRFDPDGKELQQAEAPHAHSLRTDTKQLRRTAIRQLKARDSRNILASRTCHVRKCLQTTGRKRQTNGSQRAGNANARTDSYQSRKVP